MRSFLAVTDPEGVTETSAYNIRIKLTAVSVVHLSLQGVTEAVIGHAFQLGDGPAIGFQSRNAIGVAEDLDSFNLDKELFFLRAPGFRAMCSDPPSAIYRLVCLLQGS